MTKTRKEFDSLGYVDVPADKLWAAQTQRSRNNFKIGRPGSMPIEVIYAFAQKFATQTRKHLEHTSVA